MTNSCLQPFRKSLAHGRAEVSVDDGREFDRRNTGELQQSIEFGTLGPLTQRIEWYDPGRHAYVEEFDLVVFIQ